MRRKPTDALKDKIPSLAHKPQEKTGRDRSWEKSQYQGQRTQVSYRGIPRDVHEAMKEIGAEHGLTVSEVAVVFLAYGLDAYEAGDLALLGADGGDCP